VKTAGREEPSAARTWRGSRIRIYFASLLIDCSTYSYSIVLGCHAKERLDADYWQLGKLGALSALFYSLTCLLTGGLSDRFGSLPLMMTSIALLSAGFLGTGFARTFDDLLVAGAFWGASLALFWPAIQSKLSRLSPGRTLWGALGVFNVFWAIGVGAATVATPALYAWLGLGPTMMLGFAVTLAAVPFLLERMPEPAAAPPGDLPEVETVGPVRARLFLRLAWVSNFTAFFAMVGIMRIFPRVSSDLGVELGKMGWVLVPLDLGKIIAFAVLTRAPFWHYSFRWLVLAQAAAGAALVAAGLVEAWWLLALLFPLLGALSGLTYFSSIYYGLNLREGEGKKSGLHETVLASGVCVGPLLCGLVGENFPGHPGAALVFGGLVVFAGLLIQIHLYRRVQEPAPDGGLPSPLVKLEAP
jgi:MFS family permease